MTFRAAQEAVELLDLYARNIAVGIANIQQTLASRLFIVHGDVRRRGRGLPRRDRPPAGRGAQHPLPACTHDDTVLLGAAGLVLSPSLELLA
jgi:predicted NBD/HSP70 family sugar kinase